MRPILVTGFGAFPGVVSNPSAALASAIDGRTVHGIRVVGRVIPVRWRLGPDAAIQAARELDAQLVVGVGVAAAITAPQVETLAIRAVDGRPDAEGERLDLPEGPPHVSATLEVGRFAAGLGAPLSTDAGRYVCNAWLYQVAAALSVPVGFLHVPLDGIDPERFLTGVAALVAPGTS